MSLVVFTGLCGLLAAPVPVHPVLGFTAVLCIALGAGAAGALNQWYEADLDAKMKRTANAAASRRPDDPPDRAPFRGRARGFSVILMDLAANHLAAAILAVSILFYVLVYTVWLKRRTAQNIVIGGAAGAFPPLIGWVAATGDVTTLPVLLFAIIFLWTPPHFWALSLFVRTDYANAGVPMLPVVAGVEHPPPDPALHAADDRRGDRALGDGPDRLDLWRGVGRAQRRFLVLAFAVLANKATEPKAMAPERGCSPSPSSTCSACSRRWSSTAGCWHDADPRTRSSASGSASARACWRSCSALS